jgi:hypothetical protein
MKPLAVPKFATEAEEAAWYPENEDAILAAFQQAVTEKTLRRGSSEVLARSATARPDPAE